jgi:hypothetical protein
MKTENETKFKEPDCKRIRELSHRIDCVLYESDFSTYYPNRWTDRTMADINRYLKCGGKI